MSTNPLLVEPRIRVVTLYPGEVEKELVDLEAELDEAYEDEKTSGAKRMGQPSPADALAEAHDAKTKAALEGAVKITLREIPSRVFRQTQDKCPPREGNARDAMVGYDIDKFGVDLVHVMIVDPVVDDAQFAEFAETATQWNWGKLIQAANDLCNSEVDLPKFSAVTSLAQLRADAKKRKSGTG